MKVPKKIKDFFEGEVVVEAWWYYTLLGLATVSILVDVVSYMVS